MAQPYSSGAIFYFFEFGLNGYGAKKSNAIKKGPMYLGTAEVAGDEEHRFGMEPSMNDASGSQTPAQTSFQGKHGFIQFDLTRWNKHTQRIVENLPHTGFGDRGNYRVSDLGTLYPYEVSPILYCLHARRDEPSMNDGVNAIERGMRYTCAVPVGPFQERKGTKSNKLHCVFQLLPVYDEKNGLHIFFDHNMSKVEGFDLSKVVV